MIKELRTIKPGKIPNVLMLGNGINRCFEFGNWDDLLGKVSTISVSDEEKTQIETIPYPLQAVILTNDSLDISLRNNAFDLVTLSPCEEEKRLLQSAMSTGVDAVLTTNYTYELEKAVCNNFQCIPGRRCNHRRKAAESKSKEETQALYTYMDVVEGKPIWHIHGEAGKPDSMILGHYYYGKHLSRIQQYIHGLIARKRGCDKAGKEMVCRSWIDYFMLGNISVVGLGMDLSEMDLWWLVNCKKRNFPETKITFYSPDITPQRRMLAEAYGVTVIEDGLIDGDYKSYYENIFKQLDIGGI